MKDLSKSLNNLSPGKRRLLELKLKKRNLGTDNGREILPMEKGDFAPLSFAQSRLWFLEQMEPGGSAYNVPRAVRVTGRLDRQALRQALNEVVARHESLRTCFVASDGQPRQTVCQSRPVKIIVKDLSQIAEPEREQEALKVVTALAREPFDLPSGDVFKVHLVVLGEEEQILLLSMHHIISDAWSGGILFRELGVLYEAFSQGRPSPLAPLPIQFADYAVWEQQWLLGDQMRTQLAYWRQQLSGELPVLEMPTDKMRPVIQSRRGAKESFTLPAEIARSLKDLGRHERCTPFMTLMAAFQTLLHRYTGQPEVIVGTLIANRNRVETESLIGFLINALPMRVSFSGRPSFRELLRRVREVALQAYAHQDLPFEKLVEELRPERDLSRAPIFQAMVNYQGEPKETLKLSGLKVEPLKFGLEMTTMDLTLAITEINDGFQGALEYSTDLFEAATIKRLLSHFPILLEGLIHDCDRPVTDVPLLSEAETAQVLRDWNDTGRDHPLDKCFQQLFEEQVEHTPHRVAVSFHADQLTYDELNRRANRLARQLIELGVGPEVIVAILAERSPEFLTTILAVLKAGGAYLPLEPRHPANRIRQIMEQSRSGIVLTAGELVPNITQIFAESDSEDGPQIYRIEDLIERERSEDNLPIHSTPKNLAFVTFTSGSTGVPKGVMVEHAGMVNHLYAKITDLQMGEGDVLGQTAPQTFVISVWQFLAALITGGRVHIFDGSSAYDPLRIWEEAERGAVSILEVVPSLLHTMLEEAVAKAEQLNPDTLRYMVATGEALPPKLARQWLSTFPQIPLLNAYGSTECSDDVAHEAIELANPAPGTHTPIGRPVLNTQLYVLNDALSPEPMGVTGELYVGGVGVGRGYFNDVTRTAEVFIPDPFSLMPGARLYKTGDRARFLPDGRIEYLGRIDHQVKVRGIRIELGEIEEVLAAHPEARQVVVVVQEDAQGNNSLVAYVVPEREHWLAIDELRRHVKERLPEYMVPSAIVLMDELPLTPNGKLDRCALPAPERTQSESAKAYEGAGTNTEQVLVEIFSKLTSVGRVGLQDNFFDLGGHSLLAAQVVSRVRQALGVELPLRAVFESPTPGGLADLLEQRLRAQQEVAVGRIKRVSRDGELPLSFAQSRLWFLEQMEPGGSAYNVPRAVRVTGRLDRQALRQALNEVVARHESLRTCFVASDGQPRQVINLALEVMVPEVDLTNLPEADREGEAQSRADWEIHRPFELDKAPLFRVLLLRLGAEEHLLVLTLHHLICDAWSLGVFFRELRALYEAFVGARAAPLAPLPLQYADYAIWQRQQWQGARLRGHLDYWKRQLRGAPARLALPADRPRPPALTFRGARHNVALSGDLSERLKELSREQGATPFMTLLTAFKVLLHRYSRQEDIVVGSPVANRTHAEVEGLIGLFVNTLVLRTELAGEPSFVELLARVKEVVLGALAHQEVPFEKLVEELRPERDLSFNPLFQVWFVLQNTSLEVFDMVGLKLTSNALNRASVRHDLQLSLWETSEGFRGAFDYRTDLFTAATITRMSQYFEQLVRQVLAHPAAPLSEILEMVDHADRQQQAVREEQIEESTRRRLKNIRRKSVIGS